MAGYTFDESGQYNFFLMTVLALVLFPWTYYTFRPDRATPARVKPPCSGWLQKAPTVRKIQQQRARSFKTSHILLAIGWAALAFATYQAAQVKLSQILYDPFKILGISTSLGEKEIKRHYRKLTLKFHPDKLKLTGNQTKEEVDAHFVDLTKAYKALTDETIRRNFELYGHPDGKQEMAMGIAIPKSFTAAENNVYVLGAYALLFGVLLPYGVGKWWFSSRRYTKDGVLNKTAATFYLNAKEDMTFAQAVMIVSAASEFEVLLGKRQSLKSPQFDRLQNTVKDQLFKLTGERMDGQLFRQSETQKAAIFIYAHLLRIPVQDPSLALDQYDVVSKSAGLTQALGNIILSHSWLSSFQHTVALQQAIVQAVHPALSALLALPHVPTDAVRGETYKTMSVDDYVQMSEKEKAAVLVDVSEDEKRNTTQIAEHYPRLELVSANFKVVGERIVTPGSIIQLTVKVKINPPTKTQPQPNGHISDNLTVPEGGSGAVTPMDVHAEEQDLEELLGRKKEGADGEEPTSYAYAPHFPTKRTEGWNMYIGDQKIDRVFIQPTRFTEIGHSGRIRTLKVSQQAPHNPGLYSFQLFVRSDCYIGCDVRKDMKLKVESFDALKVSEQANEDEISDPDEDSLAGQMAAMRGQNVKRIDEGYDDDDGDSSSGTEASMEDEGGTTTESDA